jgi:hypothetical protein
VAGGAASLAATSALEWDARAIVHIPGRDIAIRGTWRVAPPDRAVVSTFETSAGPSSTRRPSQEIDLESTIEARSIRRLRPLAVLDDPLLNAVPSRQR